MRLIPALALILPASISAQATADNTNVTYEENHQHNANRVFQRNALGSTDRPKQTIRGIKKMSDDEGEKFFMHYWQFDDGLPATEMGNLTNTSPNKDSSPDASEENIRPRSQPLRPAFELDEGHGDNWYGITLPRYFSPLHRRGFDCPAGTSECSSINRPNRCCGEGDTCTLVSNTGSGDVGCCPKGQSCSDTIGSCPRSYSTCSESLGGGCCIPGYECVEGGCAHVSLVTVTIHSTVMVSTKTFTTPQETSSSFSPSTSPATTGDLVPPARPTSLSTATTSEDTDGTGRGGSSCPTGFYACSAVYQGGCCQTGRDCDTTSCPTVSSTTMVSDGKTIVAPAPTMTGGTGRCAKGWFSCADTVGGGCCPTGFACGSSCRATGGSATTLAKSPPDNSGSRLLLEKGKKMLIVGMVSWIAIMTVV